MIISRFVMAVVIALSGCVSISTHDRLVKKTKTRADIAEATNEQLVTELDRKILEQEQLKGEVERVRTTYEDMVLGLKKEIAAGTVGVKESEGGLTVTMGTAVLFPSNQANLQEEGRNILIKVAKILNTSEKKYIQVEGHTDNIPIRSNAGISMSNWELSAARAASVVLFLEKTGKVPSERLILMAFGETRPLAPNDTAQGRTQNRRVEIKLVP